MKRFSVPLFAAAISLLVSACAPEVVPTTSAADVQNTAVAAAFTIVAETQAAMPTATPLPPTPTASPTPMATNTPISLPTLAATLTPVSSSGTNSDPCNRPLGAEVAGRPTTIRLVNETKGPVVASLYLNLTPFGECGFRGYNLGKGDSVLIKDLPQGCYNVSVLINDPKNPGKAFGYGCINNPDKWTFEIHQDVVKFVGG